MTCAHLIGLAGFAEFLQRVLAHSFQQPVPRSAAAAFGHHKRFVDEQGQLIENLVTLDVIAAADRLRGVEIEAARGTPPAGETRACSGSVNSACDQSTEARNVCWRRTAVRAPPVSSRKRS